MLTSSRRNQPCPISCDLGVGSTERYYTVMEQIWINHKSMKSHKHSSKRSFYHSLGWTDAGPESDPSASFPEKQPDFGQPQGKIKWVCCALARHLANLLTLLTTRKPFSSAANSPLPVHGFLGDTVKLPCKLQLMEDKVTVTQVTWTRQKPTEAIRSVAVFHPTQGPTKPQNKAETQEVPLSPLGPEPVPVASCVSTGGRPPAHISWSSHLDGKANKSQVPGPLPGTFTVISLLTLTPSSQMDGKNVTCRVEHESLEEPVLLPVTLSMPYSPEVSISGYDDNWYLGLHGATLHCDVRSKPEPTGYNWSTSTGPLPPSAVAQDTQLLIHTVDESINTTFICLVTNALGTGQAELTVLVRGHKRRSPSANGDTKMEIPAGAQQDFSKSLLLSGSWAALRIQKIPEQPQTNQDLLLSVQGIPDTFQDFNWYLGEETYGGTMLFTYIPGLLKPQRDGSAMKQRDIIGFPNGSMLLCHAQPTDSGTYQVAVTINPAWTMRAKTEVQVAEKPKELPITNLPVSAGIVAAIIIGSLAIGSLCVGSIAYLLVTRGWRAQSHRMTATEKPEVGSSHHAVPSTPNPSQRHTHPATPVAPVYQQLPPLPQLPPLEPESHHYQDLLNPDPAPYCQLVPTPEGVPG
ncbi:hypothetical protein CB1_000185002 [Camelus ferus]|nr:hypothetical protein CB1_000185002 [Camelus ferus]